MELYSLVVGLYHHYYIFLKRIMDRNGVGGGIGILALGITSKRILFSMRR